MSQTPRNTYQYQVGGSLENNNLTYVRRQADIDLEEHLSKGDFCYILNARQMGKSSLRVQVMERLRHSGFACAAIDISSIGTADIILEQWYFGVIDILITRFKLYKNFDLDTWWTENSLFSPVQRLSKFIQTVLLEKISEKIVIFIDEIDSVLSLPFNLDDFFALIRECYNRRGDEIGYRRLTFALIGVCKPSDLILDKRRTPFNIGQAIELTGFQINEAQPLAHGLEKIGNSQLLMQVILEWTGGQPFLTQKICKLLLNEGDVPVGEENIWVEKLVRTKIIENWEAQDEPEHLRTIRDRILHSHQQRTGQLLGLCHDILKGNEVGADGSPEKIELRLTGLVVKQQDKLKIYNRVYEAIFNRNWVNKELNNLRPVFYAKAISAWNESGDISCLLQGERLRNALSWAADKRLSDIDIQFLTKCRNLALQNLENALEEEKRAKHELDKIYKKAKRQIQFGSKLLGISIFTAICISVLFYTGIQQVLSILEKGNIALELQRQSKNANINILTQAIKKLETTNKLGKTNTSINYLIDSQYSESFLKEAFQNILYRIVEKNEFKHQDLVYDAEFSPDGKIIATASREGIAKLWKTANKEDYYFQHQAAVNSLTFSPNGKIIATASSDGTVQLRDTEQQKSITLYHKKRVDQKPCDYEVNKINLKISCSKEVSIPVNKVIFSPDGQIVATASNDFIKLWNAQGKKTASISGVSSVNNITFSSDSKIIAAAFDDGTASLFNLQGQKLTTLQHLNAARNIVFSPSGKIIATAFDDGTVKLWNYQGQELATLKHQDKVQDVSFSSNGKIIATVSNDGTASLWNKN